MLVPILNRSIYAYSKEIHVIFIKKIQLTFSKLTNLKEYNIQNECQYNSINGKRQKFYFINKL